MERRRDNLLNEISFSFAIIIQQFLQSISFLYLYIIINYYFIQTLFKAIYQLFKTLKHYLPEAISYCPQYNKGKGGVNIHLLVTCFAALLQITYSLPITEKQLTATAVGSAASDLIRSDSSPILPAFYTRHQLQTSSNLIRRQIEIEQQQQQQQLKHLENLLQLAKERSLHNRLVKRAIDHQPNKMKEDNDEPVFSNLYQQINASLHYMENLFNDYLKCREGKTYKDMLELWSLHDLQIHYAPFDSSIQPNKPLHYKILTFHLRMHSFSQLVTDVINDANANRTLIDHAEHYSVNKLTEFFQRLRREILRIMMENESVLKTLSIVIPNLQENIVDYNRSLTRKVRDFFIVHQLLQEIKNFLQHN